MGICVETVHFGHYLDTIWTMAGDSGDERGCSLADAGGCWRLGSEWWETNGDLPVGGLEINWKLAGERLAGNLPEMAR